MEEWNSTEERIGFLFGSAQLRIDNIQDRLRIDIPEAGEIRAGRITNDLLAVTNHHENAAFWVKRLQAPLRVIHGIDRGQRNHRGILLEVQGSFPPEQS